MYSILETKAEISKSPETQFSVNNTEETRNDNADEFPMIEKTMLLHSFKKTCKCSESVSLDDFKRLTNNDRDVCTPKKYSQATNSESKEPGRPNFLARITTSKLLETPEHTIFRDSSIILTPLLHDDYLHSTSQSSREICCDNLILSTPKGRYSLPAAVSSDRLFESCLENSHGSRVSLNSLTDDLLVPRLDSSTLDVNRKFSFESKSMKSWCNIKNTTQNKPKQLKKNSCSLCMSSFSRRKILTRNLGTPVNNIDRILLPIF